MSSAGGLKLIGEPDGLANMGDDAGRVRAVLLHLFDEIGLQDSAVGVDLGIATPFGVDVELEHRNLFVLGVIVGLSDRIFFETELLFRLGLIGIGLRIEEVREDICEGAEFNGTQVR